MTKEDQSTNDVHEIISVLDVLNELVGSRILRVKVGPVRGPESKCLTKEMRYFSLHNANIRF